MFLSVSAASLCTSRGSASGLCFFSNIPKRGSEQRNKMFESAAQAIDRKIDDPSSPQFCFILILPISFSCNSSGDLPVERKRNEEEEEEEEIIYFLCLL